MRPSIILQMPRNQAGSRMHHWCAWSARRRESVWWRKWANGALRGWSAQAQVQVRGYKEEKLGLAVRTLCFICPSYRSHRSRYARYSFLSLSLCLATETLISRCIRNCTVGGCTRRCVASSRLGISRQVGLCSWAAACNNSHRWVAFWAFPLLSFLPSSWFPWETLQRR